MPTKSWAGSRKLTAALQRSCDGLALGAAPHASSGHNCRQFQGKLTGRRQKLSTARRLCLSSAARANVLGQVIQHRCAVTDAAFTPCQKAYRRGQEPLRGCSSRSHQWRHSHRWGTAASCQPAQSPEYDGHNLREPGLAFLQRVLQQPSLSLCRSSMSQLAAAATAHRGNGGPGLSLCSIRGILHRSGLLHKRHIACNPAAQRTRQDALRMLNIDACGWEVDDSVSQGKAGLAAMQTAA